MHIYIYIYTYIYIYIYICIHIYILGKTLYAWGKNLWHQREEALTGDYVMHIYKVTSSLLMWANIS